MRFKSLDELRKTKVGALPINQPLYDLAAREAPKREHHPLSTLVQKSNGEFKRETSVAYCITIVAFGHKELDYDNLVTGAKPLRDSIATSLGVDDGDKRLVWEYAQVITRGAEGTLVEISTLPPNHGKTVSKRTQAPTRPR